MGWGGVGTVLPFEIQRKLSKGEPWTHKSFCWQQTGNSNTGQVKKLHKTIVTLEKSATPMTGRNFETVRKSMKIQTQKDYAYSKIRNHMKNKSKQNIARRCKNITEKPLTICVHKQYQEWI